MCRSEACGLRRYFFQREENQKGEKVFYGFVPKLVSQTLFSAGKKESHRTRLSFLGWYKFSYNTSKLPHRS